MRVLYHGTYRPLSTALRWGLREEGYEVDLARTLQETDRLARSGCYNAIVYDLDRVIGDLGFLNCWRGSREGTVVLFLGEPSQYAAIARRAGRSRIGFLAKPFDFTEFLRALESLTGLPRPTGGVRHTGCGS